MQRREHGRYRVWFPVRVTSDDVDGMAVNHDISAGGMLMALSARLREGEHVKITFRVPPDSPAEHVVEGRVVRIEENTEDPEGMWPYRIAVAFDDVDDALIPYLEQAASLVSGME
ncbi:MAG: PilZ domain-containing protein [Myxococcales bacterium]|nr:PilZ domain-containing protein [Myxococcales bacterium]